MKKVQVLLSAYNGARYLRQQLDSILQQDYQNISVLIRDDGSTDGTLDMIQEYVQKYQNISYYAGENLGVQNSFFHLMKHADPKADYYALSDQDDVWLPEKISRAVGMLEKENPDIPLLYASKTCLVDEQLQEIPVRIRKYTIIPSFGNALVENVCTGCTEVFNKKLLQMVTSKTPRNTVMHDWWLYLAASAFGKTVYDSKAEILYRQHSDNEVGMRGNRLGEFKARLKNFKKAKGALRRQADEFRRIFGCDYEKSKLTELLADYKTGWRYRWRLVTTPQIHRQGKVDDIIFRVLFLLGLR